jgi:F-type H+-transporting ATPase subunit b
MLIDWFTVAAQIVNFLVLVALLKHFLWGRLVRAIDEREKRIAGRLSAAEDAHGPIIPKAFQ